MTMIENDKPCYQRYREMTGLSLERAALLIGVSAETLATWEAGDCDVPVRRLDDMRTLYCAPKLTIEDLYYRLRKRIGLTIGQAAEALGIKADTLESYESGERIPPPSIIVKMIDVYFPRDIYPDEDRGAPLARAYIQTSSDLLYTMGG